MRVNLLVDALLMLSPSLSSPPRSPSPPRYLVWGPCAGIMYLLTAGPHGTAVNNASWGRQVRQVRQVMNCGLKNVAFCSENARQPFG